MNNLIINCCLLFAIQSLGFDVGSFIIIVASTVQVFIACVMGQMLQDEVSPGSTVTVSNETTKIYSLLVFVAGPRIL